MVNLNAQRNLSPDSTPWGKSIEERLKALESASSLMRNEVSNSSKNIVELTTKALGRGTFSETYQTETTFTAQDVRNNTYKNMGVAVRGESRTGNLLVLGSLTLGVASVTAASGSGTLVGSASIAVNTREEGGMVIDGIPQFSHDYYIGVFRTDTSTARTGGYWAFPIAGALKILPGEFGITVNLGVFLNNLGTSTNWTASLGGPLTVVSL